MPLVEAFGPCYILSVTYPRVLAIMAVQPRRKVLSSGKGVTVFYLRLLLNILRQMKQKETPAEVPAKVVTDCFIASEFVRYTHQLGVICRWFVDQREKAAGNDGKLEVLGNIERSLNEAALNIADLVAMNFQEEIYFQDFGGNGGIFELNEK